MIEIHEIVNSIFTSKTFILYKKGEKKAWLVDIGDIAPVLAFVHHHQLSVEGVFLTHGHFDHIYGLNDLVDAFPNCKVYVTEYTQQALASDKLNMSRYHETPFTYGGDCVVVKEGDTISLFDNEPMMAFYETPGHNPGCLTMVLGDMIFTGDAYIPGVGANTKVPRSDKALAQQSLERILQLAKGKTILAGHRVE